MTEAQIRKEVGTKIKSLLKEAAELAKTHNLQVNIGNDEDWDESILLDIYNPISITYMEQL